MHKGETALDSAKITEDDATLAKYLEEAHIGSLMAALVHVTGDLSLLRGDIKPDLTQLLDPQNGISEQDQATIRGRALEALKKLRDEGAELPPVPDADAILEMVQFIVGRELSGEYVPFLTQELSLQGEDAYAHEPIKKEALSKKDDFKVIIIGAGMSGLLAAIRLKEEGIPFVVFEKNSTVAGTWFENAYPGCRVDSPNHIYSYSFKPKDWPQHFSDRKVLWDYFEECADEYGVRDKIKFNTEVVRAAYDDKSQRWTVETKGPSGPETFEANAVVSAVGQLNRPKYPDIKGVGNFEGPAFHSARWEHQHDLKGKRIGVIGTGASAFQFVPEIAKEAGDITIFQRTPPWMGPTPNYHDYVGEGKHWLLNNFPYYGKWYRFYIFWMMAEGALHAVMVDPKWNDLRHSVSEENEMLRVLYTEYIKAEIGEDQALIDMITPQYPPGGKRALRDNGTWLRTLKRDDVHVTSDPIAEITAKGIKCESGEEHAFDVLIYGTGFQANKFLWPMEIVGSKGRVLSEWWGDDPRAYLGITVPGFPNLFCMYGPNTNIVVNGSIIFFSECEMRYIMGCLKLLIENDHGAMVPKLSVHDAYNEKIDKANEMMAWGTPHVSSWYKNSKGRVTQNWPGTLIEYWSQTKKPNPGDYDFV